MRIIIFANSFHTISGGDVIFTELGKRWSRLGARVTIITNHKGSKFCISHGMSKHTLYIWQSSAVDRLGVVSSVLFKTFVSILKGIVLDTHKVDCVFSMSDFWPDVLPAVLAKIKHPQVKWIAACYLQFPSPFSPESRESFFKKLVFYVVQSCTKVLIRQFASGIFTASELDRKQFYNQKQLNDSTVFKLRGGVDISFSQGIGKQSTKYDAVFLGRFHPQKGLEELLDIWGKVLKIEPERRLALIGTGPLTSQLKRIVTQNNMQRNVIFLGILDGKAKISALKSSRVFVSASRHDSGNIALDEALACGIPGIIYDVPKLDYPKGVIKIPVGNSTAFRDTIVRLLQSRYERARLGREGFAFIKQFDWDVKARQTLAFIQSL